MGKNFGLAKTLGRAPLMKTKAVLLCANVTTENDRGLARDT